MGFDKAQAVVAGEPLLLRTVRVSREAGWNAIVVGRERPADWPADDTRFIADRWPDCGPMGGIATALGHASGPVLALACDMPRLTAGAIGWLADRAAERSFQHGLAVRTPSGIEPLFSIYMPESLSAIEARLAAGDYGLQSLIRQQGFVLIDAPAWICEQLANMNTPQDLAALGAFGEKPQ